MSDEILLKLFKEVKKVTFRPNKPKDEKIHELKQIFKKHYVSKQTPKIATEWSERALGTFLWESGVSFSQRYA